MNNDLISREALKKNEPHYDEEGYRIFYESEIDNAQPVVNEYTKGFADGERSGRMKIVIDIPKERFRDIQRIASVQLDSNYFKTAEQIIANGVPYEERPQGEWIRTGSLGNGNAHYECSNCHYGDEHAESQEVPYCWHCGARMKGAKENEQTTN